MEEVGPDGVDVVHYHYLAEDLLWVGGAFDDFEHDVELFVEIYSGAISLSNQHTVTLYLIEVDTLLIRQRLNKSWILRIGRLKLFFNCQLSHFKSENIINLYI